MKKKIITVKVLKTGKMETILWEEFIKRLEKHPDDYKGKLEITY